MCQACIDTLQNAMDEAAAKSPPERLVVHLDNFEGVPESGLLNKEQVESQLHESMSEQCWCHPVIIETYDTRTAVEIVADYIAHDVGEILT